MAKRLVRKLSEVTAEVESQLKAHYEVTDEQLNVWRTRAKNSVHSFPWKEAP